MGLPPAGALQVFNPTPKVKLFFKSMITELLRSHTPESNIPSKKNNCSVNQYVEHSFHGIHRFINKGKYWCDS
jgi:hypothetical protein